ncbi:phenylacetate--CoA ligase family protein [Ohtaekwangia koreensis]|uniref:Phenylacetate-CoA ligase n=1 Tax=Ohtaekwangia koreensis TaxID=688867 RepID=A0A1T5JJ96_9BACT|nr:AMP-binding protein [Ohtaekwangia koreensis]SKC51489.1 phenylacetate-CoA ligase [Ohtaekwangia koreensis]
MKHTPEIEFKSKAEIKRFQEGKLQGLLVYLKEYSLFYQRHFAKNNIDIAAIKSLEDLVNIPATTKDDLQQYNWDFLCVPKSEIVEFASTSGTLGKPVTLALTDSDLHRLAYNECISFACADGTQDDLYQLMLTLDRQFMAGIAYYEGIRKLGAGLVRVGPGLPAMQWETIERLNPTTLVAVPSFIVKLIEFAKQNGIDPNKSSVKKAICIGEGLRTGSFDLNIIGQRIKDSWNIQLYSTYASTEMQTAFTECTHGAGGHHHPELLILEVIGDDGMPVSNGRPGEVTITTLGVQGMPLLRYKTGDIAVAYTEPCACGRTTSRLGPVLGRKQQLIKLKGTTIYPPGVFELLNEMSSIRDYVVEASTGELGTDELKLHLLVSEEMKEDIKQKLFAIFQARLRVVPEIYFATAQELEKLQFGKIDRKIRKFIDNR